MPSRHMNRPFSRGESQAEKSGGLSVFLELSNLRSGDGLE